MEQRTQGIILRTRPLTETSLIVHWITGDFGRISTVAKGARRPKSPFRGKLDLFFSGEFTFIRSRRSDLHTLREVTLIKGRDSFRQHVGALQRGSYATAFLELVTESDTPIIELLPLFEGFIDEVNRHPELSELVLAFEMKMLRALGITPDLDGASLSPGAQKMGGHYLADEWPLLHHLKPTESQLRELRQFLHSFLTHHVGRVPRGRESAIRPLRFD